jgi:hypothetical protein
MIRRILGYDLYRYLRKNAKWINSPIYLGNISAIRYNYSMMHLYDYCNTFIAIFSELNNYIIEFNIHINREYNMHFYMRTYLYYYNFIIWYIWNYPFNITENFIGIVYLYYNTILANKYKYAISDSIIVSINITYIIAYLLHISTNFANITIENIHGLISCINATYDTIDNDYPIYYFTRIYECDISYKYILNRRKYNRYISRIKCGLIRQLYRIKYNYSQYYLIDLEIKINPDILFTLSYYLWMTTIYD